MNTLNIQQWHAASVNGAESGSWQTIHAEDYDGSECPDPEDLDPADGWTGRLRLAVTDPEGTVLDVSDEVTIEVTIWERYDADVEGGYFYRLATDGETFSAIDPTGIAEHDTLRGAVEWAVERLEEVEYQEWADDVAKLAGDAAVEDAAEAVTRAAENFRTVEDQLRAAIRAAARAGVSEREITRRCSWSRMTVRKILADG